MMKNNDEILKSHLADLSERADNRHYIAVSEFLSLDEQSTAVNQKYRSNYTLYGGYENAERKIIAFGNDIEENMLHIVCIEIKPQQQKFADALNHRDFLGSLMNLGINRNTLGDIVIKNNTGYLFCLESISEYIVSNLTKIKHTSVKCRIMVKAPDMINELPEEEEIIVSSLRTDAVICAVYKLSRNQASRLIQQEKVFINSKSAYKESLQLKENDRISVRGYGKFILSSSDLRTTKKGKTIIGVRIYK